jgi:hypothetical protein
VIVGHIGEMALAIRIDIGIDLDRCRGSDRRKQQQENR